MVLTKHIDVSVLDLRFFAVPYALIATVLIARFYIMFLEKEEKSINLFDVASVYSAWASEAKDRESSIDRNCIAEIGTTSTGQLAVVHC